MSDRLEKIMSAVSSDVTIENLKRLLDGDLKHVGDWICEDDKFILLRGFQNSVNNLLFYNPSADYQRYQKTININGYEVPEPLRELPEGAMVYVVDFSCAGGFGSYLSRRVDDYTLRSGICHLSKENAQLHAQALLSFTRSDKDE